MPLDPLTADDVHEAIDKRKLKPEGECKIEMRNVSKTQGEHRDWLECHDKKFREEGKLMNRIFVVLIIFLLSLVGNFFYNRYEQMTQPKHGHIEERLVEQNAILKDLTKEIKRIGN